MKKKFKLNLPVKGRIAGMIISLLVDKDNVPVDRYWRRRALDAKRDNCMELLETAPAKKKHVSKVKKEKVAVEDKQQTVDK